MQGQNHIKFGLTVLNNAPTRPTVISINLQNSRYQHMCGNLDRAVALRAVNSV